MWNERARSDFGAAGTRNKKEGVFERVNDQPEKVIAMMTMTMTMMVTMIGLAPS